MQADWVKAPRWILVLGCGVPMGIGMGVFTKLDGSSWTDAAIDALGFGLLSGLVIGFSLDRRRRLERSIGGNISDDQLRTARRSAERGPIPDDPDTRAAAHRLANHQLERARRHRKLSFVAAMVALIGGFGLGFGSSPWFFLLVPGNVLGLVATWNRPRDLGRRVDELSPVAGE